jgi:predicted ATPase
MFAGRRITFDNISLLGRDIEITCLKEAYERVEGGHGQESIFIKGDAGSGKSSLLESFVAKHFNIQFFVRGKFDAISIHPMSAIFEALSQLCEQAESSDSLSSIRVKLQDSLGSNCELLRATIPQSNHILEHDISAPSICVEYNLQAIDRLHRSFRDLILC